MQRLLTTAICCLLLGACGMNVSRLDRDGYRDIEIWSELLPSVAPATSDWSAPTRDEQFRIELGAMISTKQHSFHFDCDPSRLSQVQRQFREALRADVFGAGFTIDAIALEDTPHGFTYSGSDVAGEIRLTLIRTPVATRQRIVIEMVERYF